MEQDIAANKNTDKNQSDLYESISTETEVIQENEIDSPDSTPIHQACWENNVELLKLLLQYHPNVNSLYQPNKYKYTTMHIAAIQKNVSMMKLLIQHGFDCDKFINNIYYYGDHKSVFLILCTNGNVECMDYLMNVCKDKIDIEQRDINGYNGLHCAVNQQHVSMVQYLLDNVYNNDDIKTKIFNQTVGISGAHISLVAANRGTTQDGLSIFKLLKQNKCPIHDDAIFYAASFSSLILQYMLNEQLYPDCIYLSKDLIDYTLKNARVNLVHKNVLIIAEYLSSMKDNVSVDEYKKWVINVVCNIMMNGTIDGYFKMFKEIIVILLKDCDDWKCFMKSKIVDKTLLINIQEKMKNPTNIADIVDDKWYLFSQTMIDSFEDKTLLNKYESDLKEEKKDKDDHYYHCKQNHLMITINFNNSVTKTKKKKCNCCNKKLTDLNSLSFGCTKCEEYICQKCINNVIMLNDFLKHEQFGQFERNMSQYNETKKYKRMVQQLCRKSDSLLYWTWNSKIVLPFYDGKEATKLSLKYLFKNGSNINTIFNTKYVQNQTLLNMINQNKNMSTKDSLQLLIDYKFDFEKLVNVYDNVTHRNGLIQLCIYSPNYDLVKMLFNHCKTLSKCKIDITHRDTTRTNALFYASQNDINTFKYLLSNKCFANYDEMDDKNIQIALNAKDIYGGTVAHNAAENPRSEMYIVDIFKLLQKYDFNFNTYDNYGRLPIHYACIENCVSVLSWMIHENIFNINCKTKYSRNKQLNDETPLYNAVKCNSVECVDVLCKQSSKINLEITTRDVYLALDNDNVSILKLLLCRIFMQCAIASWNDILKQDESVESIISLKSIKSMIKHCNAGKYKQCHRFLNDLFVKGYSCNDFNFIVLKLDYDLKTVINDNNNGAIMSDDDDNDIKMSTEYEIEKTLGKGTFGLVQLGIHKTNGNKVAIKHIHILNNNTQIQFVTSEIESLKKLSTHKNIINLLNYEILSNKVLLYFEYCFFGDLYCLLNQLDCFSMKISFKYFTQLLSAVHTCHKMDIIHRDLKLQNILISDTFQLKVTDFGLASIVDNKNSDKIYNVGTPIYKSPELIEGHNTIYDISNMIVLKACDVFSSSIIFWQMMNGIEYLPFQLYKKPININTTNYQHIKYGQYNQFWQIHQNSNMMKINYDVDLLLNLFEQMFEYNPFQRIQFDKIFEHEWVSKHMDDASFHMNDSALEAYVRASYHETKGNNKKNQPVSFHNGVSKQSVQQQTQKHTASSASSLISSDSFDVKLFAAEMNHQDSSKIAQRNASQTYILKNQKYNTFNPLVVMVGIEKYKNLIDKKSIMNDYINIKAMLNDLVGFDLVYQNKNGKIVYDTSHSDSNNKNKSKNFYYSSQSIFGDEDSKDNKRTHVNEQFKTQWTSEQLNQFNKDIVDNIIGAEKSNKYDGLIYFLSSHMKHDKYQHYLYDSNDQLYHCNSLLFNQFNNANCNKLFKKPKIFILDGLDPNANIQKDSKENKAIEDKDGGHGLKSGSTVIVKEEQERILHDKQITSMVDNDEIEFIDQYKRVIYSNCDWTNGYFDTNKNDGNLLINLFCASLANNINPQNDKSDLNDIVQETHARLKNKIKDSKYYEKYIIYDQNYIPTRCKVVFTTFNPSKSVESYLPSKLLNLASIKEKGKEKKEEAKPEKEKTQESINDRDQNSQSIMNSGVGNS